MTDNSKIGSITKTLEQSLFDLVKERKDMPTGSFIEHLKISNIIVQKNYYDLIKSGIDPKIARQIIGQAAKGAGDKAQELGLNRAITSSRTIIP